MSFIDKPDLKYGFWLGLGIVLAVALWNLVTMLPMIIARRRHG